MPPIQAIIPVTPGSGLDLDAVSLTIGLNTVYRETMVIADPSNATQLAGVTVGGALQVDASATTQPIIGTLTSNNAAPDGHNIGVLPAVANASHPTYTEGDIVLLSTDLTGALRVSITGTILATNNIEQWNSVALGSPTAFGTEPSGNVIGVNAEVFQGSSVVGSGNALYVQFPSAQAVTGTFYQTTQPVSIASGQVASGAFASGSIASGAIASGAIASGAIAAGAAAAGAFADGSVFVRSNAASTFPVTASIVGHAGVTLDAVLGATKPANVLQVGGNDGTNAYAIPLASGGVSVLVSGTVSIGSGPFTVVGNLTNNNAAPGATNVGTLPAVANAAAQSWTEGDQVALSVDLSGHQRVVATGAAAAGAAPVGNPVLIAGKDVTDGKAYPIPVNNTGGIVQLAIKIAVADASPNNGSYFINPDETGTALPVYPLIFNGSTWDRARTATIGDAVAATGIAAHAAYGEYRSTAPAPTTGQYSALQTDYAGSLFTKNTRRSQTAAQGTTISSTTSATAVTATPAAATFADLSQLIITVTPIAVTAIAFTATLSDGTNTYIYDIDTGVTAAGGGSAISINFNPPLPATSAATGWTVALSVNTVVAHVTTIVILQKAS